MVVVPLDSVTSSRYLRILSLILVLSPSSSWITPQPTVGYPRTRYHPLTQPRGSAYQYQQHGQTAGGGGRRLYSASYSDDSIPDEASLRRAYDSWRDFYSNPTLSIARRVSPHFDSVRFQHFKDNFVALKKANYKAWLKAKSNNQIPPPPLQLNEFGDCSAEEYQRFTTSGSTWNDNISSNNNNGMGNNRQQAPIPTQVNSKTLTPPPTATPWAVSTSTTTTTSSSSTINSSSSNNNSNNNNNNSSNNNNNNSNNSNKLEPSSSYQVQSDGTYSYVPSRKENTDDTKAASPRPTYGVTGQAGYGGGGGGGLGSVVPPYGYGMGGGGTPPPQVPPGSSGMGGPSSSTAYSGGSVGGVGGRSMYPPPGDMYRDNSQGRMMNGGSHGDSLGGQSDASSSYWPPVSNSNGPPTSSTIRNGGTGSYGYANSGSSNDPYPYGNDPRTSGYGSGPPFESTNNVPPPPVLSPDEQAALDRARSRHSMIPKGVFDEDESEDENTDSTWANFGMPKAKKIRREKMDLPPPIINGVGNGGMIGIGPNGPNMGNRPTGGTSYGNTRSVQSSTQVVGTSESYRNRMGNPTGGVGGAGGGPGIPSSNTYMQDRIRDAYRDWCNNHGKPYEEYRLPIFQKNYLEMEKYSQETGTPLKQLNKYADLSPEEFKAVKTPPSRSSRNNNGSPDWMQETPESRLESKDEFLNFGPRWGNDPPKGVGGTGPYQKDGTMMNDPITGAKRDVQGERRLRMAYQEWCQQNGKVFEEARLPIFTANLVAMEQYCLTQNVPMKPLNEYADLSPTEFQVVFKDIGRYADSVPKGSGPTSVSTGPQPPSSLMPPGMGVMAPQFASPGQGLPGPGTFGGGEIPFPDFTQPPKQQYGTGQGGYGSAVAPGGGGTTTTTTGGGGPPLSGQGGTIPPVNIASGGTTTSYNGAASRGGGTTSSSSPLQDSRPRKPTDAEFKRNAEARLKAFTEAKNRRRGDGESRLLRFAELKKQASLFAVSQNVTIEKATQIVFANATDLLGATTSSVDPSPSTKSENTTTTTSASITAKTGESSTGVEYKENRTGSTILEAPLNTTDAVTTTAENSSEDSDPAVNASDDEPEPDEEVMEDEEDDPIEKRRAVVDLSAVLSIEKDAIQTRLKAIDVNPSKAANIAEEDDKKNIVDINGKGSRSYVQPGKQTITSDVDEQMKQAEAAKKKFAAAKKTAQETKPNQESQTKSDPVPTTPISQKKIIVPEVLVETVLSQEPSNEWTKNPVVTTSDDKEVEPTTSESKSSINDTSTIVTSALEDETSPSVQNSEISLQKDEMNVVAKEGDDQISSPISLTSKMSTDQEQEISKEEMTGSSLETKAEPTLAKAETSVDKATSASAAGDDSNNKDDESSSRSLDVAKPSAEESVARTPSDNKSDSISASTSINSVTLTEQSSNQGVLVDANEGGLAQPNTSTEKSPAKKMVTQADAKRPTSKLITDKLMVDGTTRTSAEIPADPLSAGSSDASKKLIAEEIMKLEEEKLQAEMAIIQAKLRGFEEARKKAASEAKEMAAESSRLKESLTKDNVVPIQPKSVMKIPIVKGESNNVDLDVTPEDCTTSEEATGSSTLKDTQKDVSDEKAAIAKRLVVDKKVGVDKGTSGDSTMIEKEAEDKVSPQKAPTTVEKSPIPNGSSQESTVTVKKNDTGSTPNEKATTDDSSTPKENLAKANDISSKNSMVNNLVLEGENKKAGVDEKSGSTSSGPEKTTNSSTTDVKLTKENMMPSTKNSRANSIVMESKNSKMKVDKRSVGTKDKTGMDPLKKIASDVSSIFRDLQK